jgi:hypothetical protein
MGKLTELASPWRAYPHLYFPLAGNPECMDAGSDACVYRKLKLGRSGDEVRPGWQVT